MLAKTDRTNPEQSIEKNTDSEVAKAAAINSSHSETKPVSSDPKVDRLHPKPDKETAPNESIINRKLDTGVDAKAESRNSAENRSWGGSQTTNLFSVKSKLRNYISIGGKPLRTPLAVDYETSSGQRQTILTADSSCTKNIDFSYAPRENGKLPAEIFEQTDCP